MRKVLLLFGLLGSLGARAQDWEVLPSYTMRFGGHAQVRRIILCEDYEKPTPGFSQLRDSASLTQLVRLSQRRNLSRRLYAAMALSDRHDPGLPAVFGRLLRHDPPLRYRQFYGGAVHINYLHASEGLYDRLRYDEPAARSTQHPAFPSLADSLGYYRLRQQLDSVALRAASEGRHVPERLLTKCLNDNAGYPGSYAYVRKLCVAADTGRRQGSPYAAALAAYRRPADRPLLLRFGRNAFAAVAQFPDPAFWPLIEQYRALDNSFRSVDYYRAVAAYRTRQATRLLDSLIQYCITDKNEASNMANVLLAGSNASFHAHAVAQLWLQRHVTRAELAQQLLQRDAHQAAAVFAEGFLRFKPEEQGYYTTSSYERDSVALLLLRAVWQYDSAQFRPVAQHIAHVCRWSELTALCRLDQQYHFGWVRLLLLSELRAAGKPFDLYMLSSALLSYHDATTTAQVKQAVAASAVCQPATDSWCQSLQRALTEAEAVAPH